MIRIEPTLKAKPQLIDLTPLVDVIFLLLIFFITTSEILPMKSLIIENPKLQQDAPATLAQIAVIMDKDQVIYVGSARSIVDMPSVFEELQEYVTKSLERYPKNKPTISLRIDREVSYENFLRLFSEVQKVHCPIRLAFKPDPLENEELIREAP